MSDFPWLSVVIFAPLVGALFITFIRGDEAVIVRNTRGVALWTSIITFLISLGIWINFDVNETGFQFEEKKLGEKFNVFITVGSFIIYDLTCQTCQSDLGHLASSRCLAYL